MKRTRNGRRDGAERGRQGGGRHPGRGGVSRQRQQVAESAARIMVEGGIKDFQVAKQKAAERLGVWEDLPRNVEIEQAMVEYQRLFRGDTQAARLRELRETAVEAMGFFERFSPRLVGSVLRGTATEHSDVNIHLFADDPDAVTIWLMDNAIPFETINHRVRERRDSHRDMPALRFVAGDVSMEVVIFPSEGIRRAPLSPVDGRPMERADLSRVKALLDETGVGFVA
ncbi:MAG: hypothetical protein ACPGU7_06485 [Gammaproteobacteria bacterium]